MATGRKTRGGFQPVASGKDWSVPAWQAGPPLLLSLWHTRDCVSSAIDGAACRVASMLVGAHHCRVAQNEGRVASRRFW